MQGAVCGLHITFFYGIGVDIEIEYPICGHMIWNRANIFA
jgi:hypothetical protein